MDIQSKRKSSPISPQFMKPSDVFQKRKQKRLSHSPSKISPLKKIYSPLKCLQNYQNSSEVLTQKRFSPFKRKSSPKRIRNSFPVKKSPKSKRKLNFRTISENLNVFNSFDENANIESAITCPQKGSKQEVIDWTLKTRLRFLSNKAFAFRGNFRATEESAGISGFVRCLSNRLSQTSESNSDNSIQDSMDSSFASQLHKQCLVWSHPSLPWLKLFPRTESLRPGTPVSSKAPMFSIMSGTPLAEALHTDWCKSLKSLHQLLKAKHCPYFYVCANTFTALFRAAGIADCDDIHVLVTPTSTGLRKLMADEGITFTLPFFDDKNVTADDMTSGFVSLNSSSVVSESVENQKIVVNNDNIEDNEEPNVWLESLGLSQQDFPSLQSKRKNRGQENSVSRLKSLVLIKGMSSTQLFLNFLLNTRICVPNSGPLSGIPPTLLSPVAFNGSTLQSLKVKQTMTEINANEAHSCLEVVGPILPNCVNGLINLLKETHGSFKGAFTTYEPNLAFSAVNVSPETNTNSTSKAFAIENLKDCGLDTQFIKIVCSDECRTTEPITQLVAKNSVILFNQCFQ